MAQAYEFAVRDENGNKINGVLKANTFQEVLRELHNQGYAVTSIKERQEERSAHKLHLKELSILCRQLATSVRVGIPILQGLHSIQEHVQDKMLHEVLGKISMDIASGSTLTEAFSNQSHLFPPLFVKMLRAAETNGNIEHALDSLAESFRQSYEVQKKIRNAVTYPAIVFAFSLIMVCLLSVFVLPTFTSMFESMHTSLPWFTRVLLNGHQFLATNGLFLILVIVFLIVAGALWGKSQSGRKHMDSILYHLPIAGTLVKKAATFRFCQTLRDLYTSGISIEMALHLVADVMRNSVIKDSVKKSAAEVGNGRNLTDALQVSGMFPGFFLSMVHIGEETGDVEAMLDEVASFSKYELEQLINQLIAWIEPLLVIGVGLLVGGVIISIIVPLYDGMLSIGS